MAIRPWSARKFHPLLEVLESRDCPTVPTDPGYVPPPTTDPAPAQETPPPAQSPISPVVPSGPSTPAYP